MTGKAEWGVVFVGDKVGVLAVYSLSDAKPVKIGNFPARFQNFASKEHISDWKFAMTGKPATHSQTNQVAPATPVAQKQEPVPGAVVSPQNQPDPTPPPPSEQPPVPDSPSEKPVPEPASEAASNPPEN